MTTQMKAALIFKAGELYELGCNSSQAVCGALAGHYGLDQETAFRMASSFGDGTSRLRGTCGAADRAGGARADGRAADAGAA